MWFILWQSVPFLTLLFEVSHVCFATVYYRRQLLLISSFILLDNSVMFMGKKIDFPDNFCLKIPICIIIYEKGLTLNIFYCSIITIG